MKADLTYGGGKEQAWEILIEPENEIEECAFEYLATRPKKQLIITITRLGIFERKEVK